MPAPVVTIEGSATECLTYLASAMWQKTLDDDFRTNAKGVMDAVYCGVRPAIPGGNVWAIDSVEDKAYLEAAKDVISAAGVDPDGPNVVGALPPKQVKALPTWLIPLITILLEFWKNRRT